MNHLARLVCCATLAAALAAPFWIGLGTLALDPWAWVAVSGRWAEEVERDAAGWTVRLGPRLTAWSEGRT